MPNHSYRVGIIINMIGNVYFPHLRRTNRDLLIIIFSCILKYTLLSRRKMDFGLAVPWKKALIPVFYLSC